MANRKGQKHEGPTLRDIVRPIMKDLMETLMRLARAKTQAEFAEGLHPNANDISRYAKGTVVPLLNLPALGKRAGLSLGETGWLIGSLLTKFYKAYRREDLDELPGEIREPEAEYDEGSLTRELDFVLALDFTPLEPSRMVARNLERNRLRDHCDAAQAGIRREIGTLAEWLRGFRESSEEELRQAAGGRYPHP